MGTGASPLRKPGRLCHTPTSVGTAWPHGGTGMGNVTAARLYVQTRGSRTIIAEEYGEVVETLKGGRNVWLACSSRDWDSDLLGLMWSTSTGASGNVIRLARRGALPVEMTFPSVKWSGGRASSTRRRGNCCTAPKKARCIEELPAHTDLYSRCVRGIGEEGR